ncbi:MAG: glutathione S-transferase family protein [Rhodospirillaceae bacterium]|nr:glutathione S-transferase family protein [Rhodospirillaceae bacterium]
MAITIYGAPLSPFVARVLLVCGYKGLKYEITMPKDGIKSPTYLKLNPLGKIPTIVDGKTVLFESPVIVDYLDAKSKKKRLVPSAAKALGQARLVAAIAGDYVQAPGLTIFRAIRAKSNDQAVIDAAKAELAKGLDALEHVISSKKYAAGASPTVADCFAVPALFFATEVGKLVGIADAIGSRAKTRTYWQRIGKDKVAAGVLKAMGDRLKQILAAG